MTQERNHSKQQPERSKEDLEMISGSRIDWGKSKEQIWAELEKKIDSEKPVTRVIMRPWIKLAIAASFVIVAGIAVFIQVYTKTIGVPAGQHSDINLPDRSCVRLNAQSTLSYKPLLWRFSRRITFEGEAYFEVQPGKKFEVVSERGSTVVLGTTFNIYSRNDEYQVTCVTGKVKVTQTFNQKEVILNPGQKAAINPEGIMDVQSGINTELSLSWLNNRLTFTSMPLPRVFEEIGRQYGIAIFIPDDLDLTYTGTFRKDSSVEKALNLICKPFNLTYTRKSDNEYVISRGN